MFAVADFTDCCAAVEQHAAHFCARHTQCCEIAVFGDELHCSSSGTTELATLARTQLDVVHRGTDGHETQRKCVAGLDVGALTALDAHANFKTLRREDVCLRAVDVVKQCDATCAVRVVLNGNDLGLHTILDALEIDDAVLALVSTTAVTRGLATICVTSTRILGGREQRLLRCRLRDFTEVGDSLETTTCTRWLALTDTHGQLSFRTTGSCFPVPE